MFSLEQSLRHPAVAEVKTPKLPESMATPVPFYVEFGRNKKLSTGKNLFIRNEFKEVNWMTMQQHVDGYIHEHAGWGLYKTAFDYNTNDPYTADVRGDFFLDFDNEDDIRKAQEDALRIIQHLTISPNYRIPVNMIRVFFSGKKGIHVIVPYQCFGLDWHPTLDKVYKTMAEELVAFAPNKTLDLQVYERRRLFRLKGSQHPSTGSYKVPMELKNLLAKSEEDLLQLSKDPNYGSWIKYERPKFIPEAAKYIKEIEGKVATSYKKIFSNNAEDQTLDFDPPCYLEMLETGPVNGSKNAVASRLCAYWKQRGVSEQDAWDRLVEWNDKQMNTHELTTVFRSNFKGRYTYGCKKIKDVANCPATCKADCKFFKST